MKKNLLVLLAIWYIGYCTAQSGQPDPSFGSGGIVKTDMGAPLFYNNSSSQVLKDVDGNIYIICNYPTFISKRLANGAIDSSYGFNGYSRAVPFNDVCAALQPDGKILIAGSNYKSNGIARINADGKPDSSFGKYGTKLVDFLPASIAVANSGKIIASGCQGGNGVIVQYHSNGSTDYGFNGNGKALFDYVFKVSPPRYGTDSVEVHTGTINTLAVQADGKILAGGSVFTEIIGWNFAIVRYNSDGRIDSAFGYNGKQNTLVAEGAIGYSIVTQADGKIVMSGYAMHKQRNYFALVRYDSNGMLDNSFNGTGKQVLQTISGFCTRNSAVIETNGKIVIGGYASNGTDNDFALARFNTDGSADVSFGEAGVLMIDFSGGDDIANGVVIQESDKFVLAGYTNVSSGGGTFQQFAVARYLDDGTPDAGFGINGKLTGDYKQGYTVFNASVIQPDGKIISAGSTWNGSSNDFAIVRFNINGTLDNSFGNGGKQITDFGGVDEAVSLALQPDGKIIVAGNNDNRSTQFNFAVARYNSNGTPDNSFNGDGKLLVTSIGNADLCRAVSLQTDGKILLAGYSFADAYFDSSRFSIVRLNSNGSYDNSFSGDGKQLTDFNGAECFASSMVIQNDGKIIVGGRAYSDNQSSFALARYNSDGSVDNTFSNDGKQISVFGANNYFLESLALQNDGKIIAAGFRENYEGSEASFVLARYNIDGEPDRSFGLDGYQINNYSVEGVNFGISVAIGFDGRIAVGGTNDNFTLALYKPAGTPDSTFGINGIQTSNIGVSKSRIQGVVFDFNKLYAVGYGQFPGTFGVIARYLLSSGGPLPVNDLVLKAAAQNNKVLIQWETAAGQNVAGFNVQRSADGISFSSVGYVVSNGSSYVKSTYSVYDMQPLQGFNFYRLKIVDRDGGFTFSETVAVSLGQELFTFEISPNPVKNILFVKVNGERENGTLRVIDAAGRVLKEAKVSLTGNSNFSVNINGVPNGIYTLQLVTPTKSESRRFLKE